MRRGGEAACARDDPVERTNTESWGHIFQIVRQQTALSRTISKNIRLFHLDGLVNPNISNNFHGNIHEGTGMSACKLK